MITALVQFKVKDGTTRDEVFTNMKNVAPKFEGMAGLIRKNFLGCVTKKLQDARDIIREFIESLKHEIQD